MCGFTCIISRNVQRLRYDAISRMTDALIHRGPDDSGLWSNPEMGVYLGHRRLTIRDLSRAGRQPMTNEDGSVIISYNGEIYNSDDIKQDLMRRGHIFKSTTDTEVVIHSYEEYGMKATLDRVNGMFAFTLIDMDKLKLYLARDPLGIKPCFYWLDKNIFMAASEAKAFYAAGKDSWNPVLSMEHLSTLIAFQYFHDNTRTVFNNLNRLAPGELLEFDIKSWKELKKRFWRFPANPLQDNHFDPVDRCSELLEDSVRYRLISDVEIGVLLSGGIDSSIIAAMATKVKKGPVKTFTAGFDHKLDERYFAEIVAKHIGSDHNTVFINPLEINTRIEEIIPFFDDLSSLDGGIFTFYLIAEKIRKEFGIKVLLVGEGADELFGGYSWFGLSQMPWKTFPRPFRSYMHHYAVSRMFSGFRTFRDFLHMDGFIAKHGEKDIFRQVSFWELTRQLPNNFLMKVDHGTMAQSIEARVPFLDKNLVRFVYSQERSTKQDGSLWSFYKPKEKKLLRKSATSLLPSEIVHRKKLGFSIPMVEVINSNKSKVRDHLLNHDSVARHFFKTRTLENLICFKNRMYSPIEKEKEFLVWKLFLIEAWRRHFGFKMTS